MPIISLLITVVFSVALGAVIMWKIAQDSLRKAMQDFISRAEGTYADELGKAEEKYQKLLDEKNAYEWVDVVNDLRDAIMQGGDGTWQRRRRYVIP